MPDDLDERRPRQFDLSSFGAPAWREFFETHWTFVSRVVRRFGGRNIDVEDAAQDVFLVLFQRLHEFDGEAQLTTWMYQVCANVASEHRRRAARQSRLRDVLERLPFLSRTNRTPEREVELGDELALVEKVLGMMSSKRREAFILCELEELTGEEAAEILSIPVATVRTRVHYGRQDFLKFMQELGGRP